MTLDPKDYVGVSDPKYPSRLEIPEKYYDTVNAYNKLASKWFFEGVRGYVFEPDGDSTKNALKVIKTCLSNNTAEHSYKTALVAYMLASFFESIKDPDGVEITEGVQ